MSRMTLQNLKKERKRLRSRVEELEKKREAAPPMTTMWNENGEQVSSFQAVNGKVWMIVERAGGSTALHVFKTERVFFSKLVDTIRKDRLVEANVLIMEGDRFLLKQIPWEEIAIRAIRERL
ncbi:unnamed protein product [marine sediment metagenome]|uniref:Uncharacterized protein n=1 Tax=marine sediment metagenome TaxID=412755 RepID=X1HCG3_9ZZZZ